LDFTQLLEELILVLVSVELAELAYHIYKMRSYERKIDQHLSKMDAHVLKMDSHVLKMDQHLRELEIRMTKLDRVPTQSHEDRK